GVAFWRMPWRALQMTTTSVARSWAAGEHPVRILRSWVSPPADGSRSPERSHTGDAVRNRHNARCRVAVERAADRYTLICEEPLIGGMEATEAKSWGATGGGWGARPR